MRQCLTSPDGGYYTSASQSSDPSSDQFGTKGDFITSPEISQIFGELVGIWFMTEWMGQGRPKEGVQFIELGPGRGTLMSDILRTISQFRAFAGAVEEVWMVEAGETLRKKQQDVLCGEGVEMKEQTDGQGQSWWEAKSKFGNTTIKWVEDIVLLPASSTPKVPFVVAHEFFDALPIHAFESVAPAPEEDRQPQLLDKDGSPMVRPSSTSKTPQWRELLIAPTKRKFPLPGAKPSSQLEPEFQLVLAKASTPTSLVLPERARYRPLKSQPGSRIEVSPDSARYISSIAKLIGPPSNQSKPAGAALIIDYGPESTVPINSLRGIRSHKIVSPFTSPGQCDLSADVDFTALADSALQASHSVEVHGPVEQGAWLSQLGIQERAERLMKTLTTQADWAGENEAKKKEFESGWRRLVEGGPRGMGKAYKVMAILPEAGGKRRPVGFGGHVVS
jgi:NADH dehydrogenase [ubiquinone] 1 alpha subcomplex assembly factor 7